MADVVITSNATYIKSEPGISEEGIVSAYRTLRSMESVILFEGPRGTYVEVRFSDGAHWTLDVNKVRGADVTLNSVIPATNEGLVTSLAALLVGV
jgi:hypothetical protein